MQVKIASFLDWVSFVVIAGSYLTFQKSTRAHIVINVYVQMMHFPQPIKDPLKSLLAVRVLLG